MSGLKPGRITSTSLLATASERRGHDGVRPNLGKLVAGTEANPWSAIHNNNHDLGARPDNTRHNPALTRLAQAFFIFNQKGEVSVRSLRWSIRTPVDATHPVAHFSALPTRREVVRPRLSASNNTRIDSAPQASDSRRLSDTSHF
jgi:hypothetical protein